MISVSSTHSLKLFKWFYKSFVPMSIGTAWVRVRYVGTHGCACRACTARVPNRTCVPLASSSVPTISEGRRTDENIEWRCEDNTKKVILLENFIFGRSFEIAFYTKLNALFSLTFLWIIPFPFPSFFLSSALIFRALCFERNFCFLRLLFSDDLKFLCEFLSTDKRLMKQDKQFFLLLFIFVWILRTFRLSSGERLFAMNFLLCQQRWQTITVN
jgi:hypothetical protein